MSAIDPKSDIVEPSVFLLQRWDAFQKPGTNMKRREFIKLCGGAAMTWPVIARAQQMPVVGLLGTATAQAWAKLTAAFLQGMGDAGYTEGRNVAIEYRWVGGRYDRLAQMADDLVRHPVSVLVAFTTPAALAAKAA